MKRLLPCVLAALALAGCRTAPPSQDPFFQTRVRPPANVNTTPGTLSPPPTAVATPGGAITPQISPGTSPTLSPSSGITQPASFGTPAGGVGTPGRYAPQGGWGLPQGSVDRDQKTAPKLADVQPSDLKLAAEGSNSLPGGASASKQAARPDDRNLTAAYRAKAAAAASNPMATDVSQATFGGPADAAHALAAAGMYAPVYDSPPPATTQAAPSDAGPQNQLRILGAAPERFAPAAGDGPLDSDAPVATRLRLTANEPVTEIADLPPATARQEQWVAESARPATDWSRAATAPTDNASAAVRLIDRAGAPPADLARTSASDPFAASAAVASTPPPAAIAASPAKYGYKSDYSTLSGKLEYSQSTKQWKLRYIPIDGQTDQFGGSVLLSDSSQLSAYKPGDLVTVRGSLAQNEGGFRGFSPRYDLRQIERQAP